MANHAARQRRGGQDAVESLPATPHVPRPVFGVRLRSTLAGRNSSSTLCTVLMCIVALGVSVRSMKVAEIKRELSERGLAPHRTAMLLRLRGGSARAGGLRPGEGIAGGDADMHLTREFLAAAEFVRQMPGLSSEDKLVSMLGDYGSGHALCGDNMLSLGRRERDDASNFTQPPVTSVQVFYGLYKQATVGPCNTPKPSCFLWADVAKWQRWQELKVHARA